MAAAGRRPEQPVAGYVDRERRRHRIVVRGRLVLDLCIRRPAVLVAELGSEEGIDQARAVVFGGEFDVGYLARAQAGERPLGAELSVADLSERESVAAEPGEPSGGERVAA